jgi:hypothetical protein
MKLEPLNKSQYVHDSLGDVTFYNRFKKHISLELRNKLEGYFLEDSLVASYILRVLLQFHWANIKDAGKL